MKTKRLKRFIVLIVLATIIFYGFLSEDDSNLKTISKANYISNYKKPGN